MEECVVALRHLGFESSETPRQCSDDARPKGCSWDGELLHFNAHATGSGYKTGWQSQSHRSVCRAHVNVDEDGSVTELDGKNPFSVRWNKGAPAAGTHVVKVVTD